MGKKTIGGRRGGPAYAVETRRAVERCAWGVHWEIMGLADVACERLVRERAGVRCAKVRDVKRG